MPADPRAVAPRAALVVVSVVLAVGATAPACRRESASEFEPPSRPQKVRCAAVIEKDTEDTLEVRGTIAPLFGKDAQISPQVAGRVLRVSVREGERVHSGQELARVDDGTLTDQVRQADAVVARAQGETELARTTEARIRRVFERGIAARQELEDAIARLSSARAMEAESRAASAIARRQLGRASVRSPFAGVVLKVFRRAGELVDGTPATPVVEVGDPAVLEVVATVAAAELVELRVGAPARVTVPAMPGRSFPAVVSLVSPTVERATGLGTVRVRLAPAAPLAPLAPLGPSVPLAAPPIGVAALAEIDLGRARPALWVPTAALHAPTGSEAEVTLCGPDGHAHAVRVTVGRQVQAQVEIRPATVPPAAQAYLARAATTDGSASPENGATRVTRGAAVVIDPILGIEDGAAIERLP